MEYKNYLFVGGTRDGQILNCPDGKPKIIFPILEKLKVIPFDHLGSLPASAPYKIECYFLEILRATDKYFLYRHESLTTDDVLIKLLNGYKPVD